jgi:glycosyltransferase involved in cell wall biosynthesis
VVTTSPPQSAHLLGLRLSRLGIPWIAEFRDGWRFERPRGDWPLQAQRRLDARLERAVVRRADALVAVTRPIAEDLERRFGRRVALITNAFDPEDVDGGGPATDSLLDPERFSIVHTGSMGFTGATARPLVEALALVRDEAPDVAARLEVVFAGLLSTDEADLLERSDLAGIVRCVGSLERSSVLEMQRAADLLLVVTEGARRTSVATGKLFEYLATNRPILVLGAETEAARIVLNAKRGIATSADDPRVIAGALRQAVDKGVSPVADPDEVDRYSWPRVAAAYAALVDEVCAG